MVTKQFPNNQAPPNQPASSSNYNANMDGLDTDLDNIIADLNVALLLNGLRTMTGALNMGFFRINDLADPTLSGDAATKSYVDALALGIDWQDSVLDKDLTAPPGSPSTGDRYIVGPAATGAWATHDKEITEYTGSAWDFTTPNEGFACWVEDEDLLYIYNGAHPAGDWVKFGSTLTHANLLGLSVDDHTQYALLAGRSGGQSIIGGTGAGDDLIIKSTSHATKGDVISSDFVSAQFKPDGVNTVVTIQNVTPQFLVSPGAGSSARGRIAYDANHYVRFGAEANGAEFELNDGTVGNLTFNTGGGESYFIIDGQIYVESRLKVSSSKFSNTYVNDGDKTWSEMSHGDAYMWWGVDDDGVGGKLATLAADTTHPLDIIEYTALNFKPDGTNAVVSITASSVKMFQDLEIEKASAKIILDASSGNPSVDFDKVGVAKGRILQTGTVYEFYNLARTIATMIIDAETGNITKVGDIDMGGHEIQNETFNTTTGHGHNGVDSKAIPKMVVGTYVGDGELSNEVDTGLSSILDLMIFDSTGTGFVHKTSSHAATGAHFSDGAYNTLMFASGFSGGSFFVDDNGANVFPNTDGVTYIYRAYGNP